MPPRDKCWDGLGNALLAPALPTSFDDLNLTEECIAEEITLRTSLDLKGTVCPVTPENSYAWTADERDKTVRAPVASSIENLEELVSLNVQSACFIDPSVFQLKTLHVDGARRKDSYVTIPTEICEG